MSARRLLTEWIAGCHQGQLIRRTSEPYFNHLLAVAEMARPLTSLGYEIGLCHDLLEKTTATKQVLHAMLFRLGYRDDQADLITSCVVELTDVFNAEHYPSLSKAERKQREAQRLATISATSQTVKYADLIYNIGWVLTYDQKNAMRYLRKKRLLLISLNLGDQRLRQRALDLTQQKYRE